MKALWWHPALAGGVLLLGLVAGGVRAAPCPDYAERAAKLKDGKDAEAWLRLADYAEEQLLWKEREEALREAVGVDPDNAEAHERLDEIRIGGAWLPADEAEAKEAAEYGARGLVPYGKGWIPSQEADTLREADRKDVGWPVAFRLDTPHLRIFSGRPLPFTRRLASVLENEVAVYGKVYGKTFKLDPKPLSLRVCVFPDRDTFERVVARETGCVPPASAVGGYSPGTQVLYVGTLPTQDPEAAIFINAVHEMTHALDDLSAHVDNVLPPWLAEGRANHLGYSIHGRRILPGATAIHPADLILQDLAKAIDGADLREVMALDPEAFMGKDVLQRYAIAWAWVHFLFHGQGGEYAPGFLTYLRGIPGKTATAHFESAVGKLPDLEPEFKRYVKEELIPAATSRQARPGGK